MAKNQEIIDQIRGLLFSGDRAGIIEPTMQAAGVPGNDLGAASTPGPRFEIKPGILDPTRNPVGYVAPTPRDLFNSIFRGVGKQESTRGFPGIIESDPIAPIVPIAPPVGLSNEEHLALLSKLGIDASREYLGKAAPVTPPKPDLGKWGDARGSGEGLTAEDVARFAGPVDKMTPGTGYITTGTGKNKRTEFINDKERIREPIYLDQAEAVSKLLTSMGHYGVGMDTQKTKEMLAESKMQADAHKMLMDYSPKSTILDDDGKPTAIPNEHLGLIKMVRAGTLPKYLEQAGKTATAEMDAAIQEMHKLTLPELRKQKELQGMTDVQIFEKMQPTYLRKYAQSHHEKHGEQYKKKEKK
jgi:hypothetical protein